MMFEYHRPFQSKNPNSKHIDSVKAATMLPSNWTYQVRVSGNNYGNIVRREEIHGLIGGNEGLLGQRVEIFPVQRIPYSETPKKPKLTSTSRKDREKILGEAA